MNKATSQKLVVFLLYFTSRPETTIQKNNRYERKRTDETI